MDSQQKCLRAKTKDLSFTPRARIAASKSGRESAPDSCAPFLPKGKQATTNPKAGANPAITQSACSSDDGVGAPFSYQRVCPLIRRVFGTPSVRVVQTVRGASQKQAKAFDRIHSLQRFGRDDVNSFVSVTPVDKGPSFPPRLPLPFPPPSRPPRWPRPRPAPLRDRSNIKVRHL